MIEQFGYVAEGMQIGLSKGAESIFNIADKLSSGIADALTSPIAMSALSPAGIEQTAQLNQSIATSVSGKGEAMPSFSPTISITANSGASAEEIAAMAGAEMSKFQDKFVQYIRRTR